MGDVGGRWAATYFLAARAKSPRSFFTNRASLPLRRSRRIEAYSVASGVLPPGLDQSFRLAIASTIALQFIGSLAAARTRIAVWNWLSFLAALGLLPLARGFAAGLEAFFVVVAICHVLSRSRGR